VLHKQDRKTEELLVLRSTALSLQYC